MNIKAVIFDMDGVIFDTERVSQTAWFATAPEYGFDTMPQVYPRIIGTNTRACHDTLITEYGDAEKADAFLSASRERFFTMLKNDGIPLKDGVRELLAFLKESGYKTALASSTDSGIVKNELTETNLIDCFDFIIGGDMVTVSKPDPQIFLKAADALGISPDDAIVIEDSHNGIRAAHRGGFFAVMVPDLMPVTDEMKEKAGIILPSLNEVKDWIQSQN